MFVVHHDSAIYMLNKMHLFQKNLSVPIYCKKKKFRNIALLISNYYSTYAHSIKFSISDIFLDSSSHIVFFQKDKSLLFKGKIVSKALLSKS